MPGHALNMLSLLSISGVGFFLGMRHAMDADHIVAVTTIASRERTLRQAAWIGVAWGIGHTLTVMVAGGLIVWVGLVISPDLGLSMEMCVGLMLVGLGIWNLNAYKPWLFDRATVKYGVRTNSHSQGDCNPPEARLDSRYGERSSCKAVRPFVVGVVHGLAGSAAVAMLVLPVINNPAWAIAYLAIFNLGTILGMMLITSAIALPLASRAGNSPVMRRRLGFAAGLLSVGFGAFMIYEIGFVQGLLTR